MTPTGPGRRPGHPILGLTTLVLCTACGSPAEPEPAEPDPPEAYSLYVDIEKLTVEGDCEDTPGNPGEFVWQAIAQVRRTGPSSAKWETQGFPSEAGAQSYSENAPEHLLSGFDFTMDRVSAAHAVRNATVTFTVGEHDPDGFDARMNLERATKSVAPPVEPPLTSTSDRTFVRVGSVSSCRLRFDYVTTWTPVE